MKYSILILLVVTLCINNLHSQESPDGIPEAQKNNQIIDPDTKIENLENDGSLIIKASGFKPKPVPFFYSASSETTYNINSKGWSSNTTVEFKKVQGQAKIFSLGLAGNGNIKTVSGQGILDWAIRQSVKDGKTTKTLEITVGKIEGTLTANIISNDEWKSLPNEFDPLTINPGDAIGFASILNLNFDQSVDLNIKNAVGLVPIEILQNAKNQKRFQALGNNSLTLDLRKGGTAIPDVDVQGLSIEGQFDANQKSSIFSITGTAKVSEEKGGKVTLLSGHAALTKLTNDPNYSVKMYQSSGKSAPFYELNFDKPGTFQFNIEFRAGLISQGDWKILDFKIPSGAIVPVRLKGLSNDVSFDPKKNVFPTKDQNDWVGFLPADGHCSMAWKESRNSEEGKLFFTADSQIETTVGAGLLRQTTNLNLNLLQGKLNELKILIEGTGEILTVDGANVLDWTIRDEGDNRFIDITTARPVTKTDNLIIKSQTALGEFPLKVEPLKLTPQNAVRYSGYLRISNDGAVRIETSDISGLIQTTTEKFPGAQIKGEKQIIVYQFPSSKHSYNINIDQILPEISVSQIVIYELTESDRIISAQVELDIREAPIREWSLNIPSEYDVVSVAGADVSDYVASSEVENNGKPLKILFKKAVSGRQLIEIRLTKKLSAEPGEWTLAQLTYPNVKSVRGHVGVKSAPGYRITTGSITKLVEIPQAYFPVRIEGLQQTYRIREENWNGMVNIEALDQSVQADVFHLYSLKEGTAYGSVLLNYFVVGAPVNEWKLNIPPEIGNIVIDGQNVRDWTRDNEKNQVVVSLHQPTLGAATLLITFEQPMNARGGSISPGKISPIGVQGERGYIQIVSPSQVKHDITEQSSGLLKMEPLELPAEFRLLSSSPSLAVFQYSARPFKIDMNIEWFEQGKTTEQVVDFSTINSHVSSDGQIVTSALFLVKTRGSKALRLKIPEGINLWDVKVNQKPVTARNNGEITLIPMSASLDANTPVEVSLKLGQPSKNKRNPIILTPTILAPTLTTNWKITADSKHLLIPSGKNASYLERPVLVETGFEWIQSRGPGKLLLIGFLILIGVVVLSKTKFSLILQATGISILGISILMSLFTAVESVRDRNINLSKIELALPVLKSGESIELSLKNIPKWEAMVNWLGVVAIVAGVLIYIVSFLTSKNNWFPKLSSNKIKPWLYPSAITLMAGGLLSQHGGAILFFLILSLIIYVWFIHWPLVNWFKNLISRFMEWKDAAAKAKAIKKKVTKKKVASEGTLSGLIAVSTFLAISSHSEITFAEHHNDTMSANQIVQKIDINNGRLYGSLKLSAKGITDDTIVLLNAPAILTSFEGNGVRLSKQTHGDTFRYVIILERNGFVECECKYELAVKDNLSEFQLPTSSSAVHDLEIRYDQSGWEFNSTASVRTIGIENLKETESGVQMTLGLEGSGAIIKLSPLTRDTSVESAEFNAEVSNLFLPGPGLVDGYHQVTVRPSRGEIRLMQFKIPQGFTVSGVKSQNINSWRFDPDNLSLKVEFSPSEKKQFNLDISTQMDSGALPSQINLSPISVNNAKRQFGMLGIGFGQDSQPGNITVNQMSKVNTDDFDLSLVNSNNNEEVKKRSFVLHQAYRYQGQGGTLTASALPVSPEVRVQSNQTLSIGSERIVLALDLNVNITRTGLFKLSFIIPEGLEIESASGPSLSHWTESTDNEIRVITLHLNGRTLGSQGFSISVAGATPGSITDWKVPRISLREATRENGQLLIVPEQGIRIQTLNRNHVQPKDARSISGNRPGTLAFGLLQSDWDLSIGIESLEPWVTSQVLHEVTLREGITKTRLTIDYRVENAAVKSFKIRLPDVEKEFEKTVRASGSAVADIVKVEGNNSEGLWEIQFKRRILGNSKVEINYQKTGDRENNLEKITTAKLENVGQSSYWVAVRMSGHFELTANGADRGWNQIDWSSVPRKLLDPRDRSVAALTYRAVEPDQPLSVKVQRHAVAESLNLRVSSGAFKTIFSTNGTSITESEMQIELVEKSTMRVQLPEKAELVNTFVNGQSAAIVKEKDSYLFYVYPKEDSASATVSLVWFMNSDKVSKKFTLEGPKLNVPLQNIQWKVVLPAGYELIDEEGTLDLLEGSSIYGQGNRISLKGISSYRDTYSAKNSARANDASIDFQNANKWKEQGDQAKARSAFQRLSKIKGLDEAANEDARVQLRKLQTEQAVVGLNTRRQRFYLDNRVEDPVFNKNELLEQAADVNPLLQGDINYKPDQVDDLLQGNTKEENDALQKIASRIVGQQIAAEPALQALDVTLLEQGNVLTFKRSVQVDGDDPLEITLSITKENRVNWIYSIILLLIIALSAKFYRANKFVKS